MTPPATMQSHSRAILFDLDGTLIDTGPDLAAALNRMLRAHGKSPLPYSDIRPYVSHGSPALIKLGFKCTPEDPRYDSMREEFLNLYAENVAAESTLFPGMDNVLDFLDVEGVPWGIVTNKPGWLTAPLLEALALDARPQCVVAGDTLPVRKPDPAPLLHGLAQLGTELPAELCIYVGDADRDVEAGKRAGMRTIVARYGYLLPDDEPHTWQADALVDSAAEVKSAVENLWTSMLA